MLKLVKPVAAPPSLAKTLMRRLMGQTGGRRPAVIYTHPVTDKIGPRVQNMALPSPTLPFKPKGY